MSTHSSLSLAGECEKCVSFVFCVFLQEFIKVRTCRTGLVLQWSNKRQIATNYFAGLHKLWYPGIRDTSTWSKFGAHGEHGDVFLFSNLGAL